MIVDVHKRTHSKDGTDSCDEGQISDDETDDKTEINESYTVTRIVGPQTANEPVSSEVNEAATALMYAQYPIIKFYTPFTIPSYIFLYFENCSSETRIEFIVKNHY